MRQPVRRTNLSETFHNCQGASAQPSTMKKSLDLSLPRIECDFNTMGLGGEERNDCIYSFSRSMVPMLRVGITCILYSFDTDSEITACEAVIEPYKIGWKGDSGASFYFCGFRARPLEDTWYWGPIPWVQNR